MIDVYVNVKVEIRVLRMVSVTLGHAIHGVS